MDTRIADPKLLLFNPAMRGKLVPYNPRRYPRVPGGHVVSQPREVSLAECKICGERLSEGSGIRLGEAAVGVGRGVGILFAIHEVIYPGDDNYLQLTEFISTGASLGKALHLASHSRGPTSDPW